MTLIVQQHGEGDALSYFVNKAAPEDLVLRLFVSNTTPAETDTAEAYTEAFGDGYEAITLIGDQWGMPTEGSPTVIAYERQSWLLEGSLDVVYGYFMTRAISGRVALAERFSDGPYVNPKAISLEPRIAAD